ncbi:MAG: hypothetical protein LAO78_09360 [Acidobacteriia bacterium]|nr:hypothetical protein [Terriglobia bacterium]
MNTIATDSPLAAPAAVQSDPIKRLQEAILLRWGQTEKELGPLFYELRLKLKAPGKKGQGFGAWLAEHGIPRATADRWADNHEIRLGKRPAKTPTLDLATNHQNDQSTFPQTSNAFDEPTIEQGDGVEIVTGQNVTKFSLVLSKEQFDFVQLAEARLRLVYGTSNASETIYALVAERYATLPSQGTTSGQAVGQ